MGFLKNLVRGQAQVPDTQSSPTTKKTKRERFLDVLRDVHEDFNSQDISDIISANYVDTVEELEDSGTSFNRKGIYTELTQESMEDIVRGLGLEGQNFTQSMSEFMGRYGIKWDIFDVIGRLPKYNGNVILFDNESRPEFIGYAPIVANIRMRFGKPSLIDKRTDDFEQDIYRIYSTDKRLIFVSTKNSSSEPDDADFCMFYEIPIMARPATLKPKEPMPSTLKVVDGSEYTPNIVEDSLPATVIEEFLEFNEKKIYYQSAIILDCKPGDPIYEGIQSAISSGKPVTMDEMHQYRRSHINPTNTLHLENLPKVMQQEGISIDTFCI